MKTKTKVVKKEEFFTDAMHSKIYIFQERISTRGYSTGKPVMGAAKFLTSRKTKIK